MKLIEQTILVFTESKAVKRYEIDLCEVGIDAYVVNFRYGKAGLPLKEGSKTSLPVARNEADRVYRKTIQEQREKGYMFEGESLLRPTTSFVPPAENTPPKTSVNTPSQQPSQQSAQQPNMPNISGAASFVGRVADAVSVAAAGVAQAAATVAAAAASVVQGASVGSNVGSNVGSHAAATSTGTNTGGSSTSAVDAQAAAALKRRMQEQQIVAILANYDAYRMQAEALAEQVRQQNAQIRAQRSNNQPYGRRTSSQSNVRDMWGRQPTLQPLRTPKKPWALSRVVWRAGEFRLRAAEPYILRYLERAVGKQDTMLRYACVWALGHCGTASSLEMLAKVYRETASNIQFERIHWIAMEALLKLSDSEMRAEFIADMQSRLPENIQAALTTGEKAAESAVRQWLKATTSDAAQILYHLYVLDGAYDGVARKVLLEILQDISFTPPFFKQVRRIFKAAEYRNDGKVWGIIARRIEKTPSNAGHVGSYHAASGRRVTEREMSNDDAPFAFTKNTRLYLRQRQWRILDRLGRLQSPDYVRMASGILVAYTDGDARANNSYDDGFCRYLAFNHILNKHSPQHMLSTSKRTWRMNVGRNAPKNKIQVQAMTAAYAKLWLDHPTALLYILDESRSLYVHKFAILMLNQCPQFLQQLGADAAAMMLRKPYDVTAQLGLKIAERVYRQHLDTGGDRGDLAELFAAMASSKIERAYTLGMQWISDWERVDAAGLCQHTQLFVDLATSQIGNVRTFAHTIVERLPFRQEQAEIIVARCIASIMKLTASEPRLLDSLCRFSAQIATRHRVLVNFDVVLDLLRHPTGYAQDLGANLLALLERVDTGLAHKLPDDTLVELLQSTSANLRSIGTRFLMQHSDESLKKRTQLWLRLLSHKDDNMRTQLAPIVVRLALADDVFALSITQGLIEAVLRRKLPEGVGMRIASLLKSDLVQFLSLVPREVLWRLLSSDSPEAQDVASSLLGVKAIKSEHLSLEQVVRLANHEVYLVREAAWQMLVTRKHEVETNLVEAVAILEGKWDDTRQFARQFFRTLFDNPEYQPPLSGILQICDAVHPQTQALGRELLQRFFKDDDGPTVLEHLCEHPAGTVQLFVTNFVERFASNHTPRLRQILPYCRTVLTSVNKSRVAKTRLLKFLHAEALRSEENAAVIADLYVFLSATCSIEMRAAVLSTLVTVATLYPTVAAQMAPVVVVKDVAVKSVPAQTTQTTHITSVAQSAQPA